MIDASKVRAEYLEKKLSKDIEKKIAKAAKEGYPAVEVDYLSDALVKELEANDNLIKIWDSQAQIRREKGYAKSTLERALNYKRILDNSYWRRMEQ